MSITSFSADPGAILAIAVATALYVRAVWVLRCRGQAVPFWQQAAWYTGMALIAIALVGPPDALSDELLSAHMVQHLLLADLAAPLLLVGLRTPVLYFYLPQAILVPLARQRRLRRALRTLRRPLVAIAVYIVVLYGWHVAFEAALRNDVLHVLQHQSFIIASVLVWWPALEPKRRRLRGELWKAGHIAGARFAGMFLGMAFLAMRVPAYGGFYGESARAYGLTPLGDQQIAGGLMLMLDTAIMLAAVCYFFLRAAREDERAAHAEHAADAAVSERTRGAAVP